MARLGRLEMPPQVIVFTGDLADRAEPKAYVRLREIVEPAAAELGAEVVWVMGNHDEREHYARELFGEEVTDGRDPGPGPRRRRAAGDLARHQRAGLPPRRALGRPADLARRRAGEPAEHGTLLALHHPPIPVPMIRAAELIELHDQQRSPR